MSIQKKRATAPITFYQRHNIQRAVLGIEQQRPLKDFTFEDLVFIATFGSPAKIPDYAPNQASQAREDKETAKEFDFFAQWQKYCKALKDSKVRALVAYEGALSLVARELPESDRKNWYNQHSEPLSQLQAFRASAFPEPSPSVRYFEPPNDGFFPMQVPAWDRLIKILSNCIQDGMSTSQDWKKEFEQGSHPSWTDTLCLFWPATRDGDFVMDIIVSKACAITVSDARQSNDTMMVALGFFLFDGVMSSKCIQAGGGLEDAVKILDYNDNDRKIRIVLSYLCGWDASKVFPSH